MKSALLSIILIAGFSFGGKGQIGNSQLQASAQVSFPVANLKNFSKTGYGFAGKALLGFGRRAQQATIEAGYAKFNLNQPQGFATDYSTIPIYLGYRYLPGKFFIEPQIGIAIDHFSISNIVTDKSTEAHLGWAASVGYLMGKVEVGAKYQSSMISGTKDLSFISIRLAYNFKL